MELIEVKGVLCCNKCGFKLKDTINDSNFEQDSSKVRINDENISEKNHKEGF